MNPEAFKQTLKDKGFHVTKWQMDQFERYYQTLVEWNEKMNLTAITDRKAIYLKHFYDSLTAVFYVDFTQELSICDVGAGAGFPSIPLKILYPHLSITIVDSLKKRLTFLDHLVAELQLNHITLVHSRAELFGQDTHRRDSYDVVMARAVARLSVLSEFCMPLCKNDGSFIAMKGTNATEEIQESKRALKVLGGGSPLIHTFTLPVEESERSIVITVKQQQTPNKYPRKPGTPKKDPIR